jgi:hypothetical protein
MAYCTSAGRVTCPQHIIPSFRRRLIDPTCEYRSASFRRVLALPPCLAHVLVHNHSESEIVVEGLAMDAYGGLVTRTDTTVSCNRTCRLPIQMAIHLSRPAECSIASMQEDALPNLYNFTVASLVQLSFSRRVLCHSYTRCVFTYFGSVSSFLTTRVDSTGMPKGVDISHASVTNALLLNLASLGVDCKSARVNMF